MKFKVIVCMLTVALLSAFAYSADDDNEKKREKSRKMATETLQELYKLQPSAQAGIQKSVGYAIFNNTGANLLLLSTARGAGIAINSQTKQEIFMKMVSAGAGLGVGVKDYRVIFEFENDKAFAPIPRFRLVGFSAIGCCRKSRRQGWSLLGSDRGCSGRLGLPDHQEWRRTPTDPPGHQVLQGRRP